MPEGEDPDDLVRSGGREAVSQLLAQALPLVDLIWIRETENKIFATPERRAGLERRFGEIVRDIRDETLRRYYQAEFKARLSRLFGRQFARDPSRPFRGAARTAGSKPAWQRVGGPQTDLTLAAAGQPELSRHPPCSDLDSRAFHRVKG